MFICQLVGCYYLQSVCVLCMVAFTAISASVALAATPASSADGRALYHGYCSVCHGDRGDGDSRARNSMRPPPLDFTSAHTAAALTRERMIAVVGHGKPGTAMAGWGSRLSPEQIGRVVDYIKATFVRPTTDDAASGSRVYSDNCSVCHGDGGRGAKWASTSLYPRPRDFGSERAAAELDRSRMVQAVTYGRADTAMPGFGKRLTAIEIEAVVDHIRARFMQPASALVQTFPPRAPGDKKGAERHASRYEARTELDTVTAVGKHSHGFGAAGQRETQAAPQVATSGSHDHNTHRGRETNLQAAFENGLYGDPQRGRAYYRQNCVACHGEEGNGRGPRAYFILPKPRNFTDPASRHSFNRPHLFTAISRGTIGTEMPAWDTVLNAQAIADISEYLLQAFVLGGAAKGVPTADSAPSLAARPR